MTVANMADVSSNDVAENSNKNSIHSTRDKRVNAFERLTHDLANDERYLKEITLGKRIGFYRIRGELGTGNFCQVKMGIHSLTKEKVAIKILDKTKLDQKTQRLLSREISSMEKLHHPNIIRLYEVIETLSKLHLVMEYACGGELFAKISNEGKLPEKSARKIFKQVAAAVGHMHDNNIIHRDLKAENVFIAGPNLVKVGDFGFSTVSYLSQTLNTFCGSPPYAAPELFKDEHYVGIYVDVWALGIMLYFIVTGVMPFRAETVGKLKKCILDGTFYMPEFLTESLRFLIKNLLRAVPSDRFTIDDIKRSAWLEGEVFPEEDQKYTERPPPSLQACSSEDEKEAIISLNELGISSELISKSKDSRDSICGTYRIILHRIQKRKSELLRKPSSLISYQNGPAAHETRSHRETKDILKQQKQQPKSKFCVIL